MAEGLDFQEPLALYIYEAYLEGRITKLPYKGHITPGKYLDKLIHMDTIRPLFIANNSVTYFIYFYYNKTKEVKYYIIKYKSESLAKFKLF
jgi:hypothetical protein